MSPAALTALITALVTLVTAIGGVIALFRHVNGPAHKP